MDVGATIFLAVYAFVLQCMTVTYRCVPYEPTKMCEVGTYEIAVQSLASTKKNPIPSKHIIAMIKARCVMKKEYVSGNGKTRYRYVAMYADVGYEINTHFYVEEESGASSHGIDKMETLEIPAEQAKVCRVEF